MSGFGPLFASSYSIDFATFSPIQNEFYKKLLKLAKVIMTHHLQNISTLFKNI
jgi:hypothetical protein